MASSSSSTAVSLSFSSPIRSKKYDVFISFRGDDTRASFTCHLNPALRRRNVETYIDDRLDRGDVISDTLMEVSKDSCASLIIFSVNYASSKWCLDELTKIMECKKLQGQIVIPVFYKIDPSHVRKQSGSYLKAFEKHKRYFMVDKYKLLRWNRFKVDKNQLLKWKDALTEAADLAGYHSQSYRTDYELIEDIVKGVLQKLNHINPSEFRGLVGVEQNCALIESLLRKHSSEVRRIGITGIGDIGKTTLATILFAKLAFQFEGRCFLENVRTKSEKYGLSYLRSMLLSETLGEENPYISTPQAVESIVLSKLKSKKVFIVLDDVSNLEQLEYFVGECDWLGLGSRVIVTGRENAISRGVDEIYEVKKLNFKDSLKLFSLNAFNKPMPEMQYEEHSIRAVLCSRGIPLTLIILSTFLRSKNEEQWDNALRELKEKAELRDVLRLIYDDLYYDDKFTFFCIVFFLKGLNKNDVIRLLHGWVSHPHIMIRSLVNKALVTISNHETIEMHHSVQEMGREIFHESSKYSRLLAKEDRYHTLKTILGLNAVEGTTTLGSRNGCNVCLPSSLETLAIELRYPSKNLLKPLPSTFETADFSMPNNVHTMLLANFIVLHFVNQKIVVVGAGSYLQISFVGLGVLSMVVREFQR